MIFRLIPRDPLKMTSKVLVKIVLTTRCLNITLCTIFLDKYRSIKKRVFYLPKRFLLFLHLVNKNVTSIIYTRPVIYTLLWKIRYNFLVIWLKYYHGVKVAARVEEKTEVLKKRWNLQVVLVLRFASWKKIIFYHGGKKRCFFFTFIMKLSSAAPSYFNAHSTLKFARTFYIFNGTVMEIEKALINDPLRVQNYPENFRF